MVIFTASERSQIFTEDFVKWEHSLQTEQKPVSLGSCTCILRKRLCVMGIRNHIAAWHALRDGHASVRQTYESYFLFLQDAKGDRGRNYSPLITRAYDHVSIHITFKGLQSQSVIFFQNQKLKEVNLSKYVLFTTEMQFRHESIFNLENIHEWNVNNPHVAYLNKYQQR